MEGRVSPRWKKGRRLASSTQGVFAYIKRMQCAHTIRISAQIQQQHARNDDMRKAWIAADEPAWMSSSTDHFYPLW